MDNPFSSLRFIVLLVVGAVIVTGVLIASAVISATSSPSTPDLTSPAAIAVATRSLPASYTVRPGDTFDTIAAAHHLTYAQLQQLQSHPGPDLPGGRPDPAATPTNRRHAGSVGPGAPVLDRGAR